MSFLYAGVNRTGHKIDAGQQAQRSVSDIFMIARQAAVSQRLWRQIRRRRSNRLDAGLFIIGDDCKRRAFSLVRGIGLLEQFDFTINAQDLGHLLVEQGIAALQIIAHLVRLNLVGGEDLAQRSLGKIGKAFVSCGRTVFANMSRQQPSCPQFVWIAEALWFAAGKIDNESSRFFRDNSLTSRTRTVVESSYDAEPFDSP